MIVPDANLLLYAYDAGSPFHTRAATWWADCLSGSERVALCSVVVFAFVRIGTSRRVFLNPMTISEAANHVRSWFERSTVDLLTIEGTDVVQALEWLEDLGSGANLTTDAQIAAFARRHRATVHTADTDFQRFRGVQWINPIIEAG